jgi:hypothetical protein
MQTRAGPETDFVQTDMVVMPELPTWSPQPTPVYVSSRMVTQSTPVVMQNHRGIWTPNADRILVQGSDSPSDPAGLRQRTTSAKLPASTASADVDTKPVHWTLYCLGVAPALSDLLDQPK